VRTHAERRVGPAAVIKVGGGILQEAGAVERVGPLIAGFATRVLLVVIPGGGPFAATVREVDHRLTLPADAAHWMAILAMDQFAEVLAAFIPEAKIVEGLGEIEEALAEHRVPVLAPYRWLHATDELPHSWDVTSDSLAAYLTGLLGAERLLLVKPVEGPLAALTDPYFPRALPAGTGCKCVTAATLESCGDWLTGEGPA
jgi:aspartokinase-like uncharacterized kinase